MKSSSPVGEFKIQNDEFKKIILNFELDSTRFAQDATRCRAL